jgi:hypothetical protein
MCLIIYSTGKKLEDIIWNNSYRDILNEIQFGTENFLGKNLNILIEPIHNGMICTETDSKQKR